LYSPTIKKLSVRWGQRVALKMKKKKWKRDIRLNFLRSSGQLVIHACACLWGKF